MTRPGISGFELITERKKMSQYILDGHKLAWHRERVEAWLKGERIAPITIDCALTRRCSYNCVYCYGKLQQNDEKKMTRDVIFRFLDDAAKIGVKAVSFVSDGESTCSPYLKDAILRGRENGLDMALGTNGFLLNPDELEDILPALTYLRFNVSAGEADRYARIHGVSKKCFYRVIDTIRQSVRIKKQKKLDVTLGMQMVLMPEFSDQIIPLTELSRDLLVDYLVIKHCSDDEKGSLGVDYSKYHALMEILKKAESYSTDKFQVSAKWSKIFSDGKRSYSRCFGPPFILQMSGSGLVAPCGMLFNSQYSKYHIGNIVETSFKEIWESERYWQVMDLIASEKFDARTMCGCLCLQHKVNEHLDSIKALGEVPALHSGLPPMHKNFI
ncbi:MAG: radical SAM protein [Desulfobacterales bacterium RIFOXYA12_FULL_46_15]|nr:MAG: radical SAM protein [Desulfobacterales bacterium RIFOXYA12_FULL_46_15]